MTDDRSPSDYDQRAKELLGFSRWWLIVGAALAMAVVSPYQYVWSSIEGPLARDLNIPLPQLGLVFTLFVIVQAGSQFPVGWWRDRHGPRLLTALGAVLAGGGYFALSYATEVWQLYLFYSLGALGVGIVYTIAVNTALKWFPDRRGLTTGIGTMAFAGGGALFVPFVRANAATYVPVLRTMGLIIAVVVAVAAVVLRDPPETWFEINNENPVSSDEKATTVRSYGTREVLRTWQFWLMYAMFVAVSGAGLMLTAKIVSFAQHLDLTELTATMSATLLPVAGGIGRLLIGDLSDRIDRERAMTVSFLFCGLGLVFVVWFGLMGSNLGFVVMVILATFFWSPQYTLFPSLVGEYYGERHSSTNYALLYSGKMWGGVFGGALASWLVVSTSWAETFLLGGVFACLAGVAALLLRPPDGPRSPQTGAVETVDD
jgi:OFA family oxalate/formate antiporter-like MFS transporter